MSELFSIGASVVVLSPVMIRDGEDIATAELQEMPIGEILEVVAHGLPASRRLLVRHAPSGLQGWISSATRSGEELLQTLPAKVWNFLLPNSGTHHLRIEHIGTPNQRLIVDGHVRASGVGSIFEGPGHSLLELRHHGGDHWSLLVDGLHVEDCKPGRRSAANQGIRELRNKPDGSYLISTEFDAGSLELNVIRKFRFFASGRVHEVRIAHSDCVWQVICDGRLVERRSHRLTESTGDVSFRVELEDGHTLEAAARMAWQTVAMVWKYTLVVNGVPVLACWVKSKGDIRMGEPFPVVMAAGTIVESSPVQVAIEAQTPVAQEEQQTLSAEPLAILPQGVSFDSSSGTYQANIRARSGKFVFLGEFLTPEEAHQRYLEAVPAHCHERPVAPIAMERQ